MSEQPRTRITIETRSRTLIRRVMAPPEDQCLICGISVPVLSTRGAAMLMGVSESAIETDLFAGRIHPLGDGGICGLSVVDRYSPILPRLSAAERLRDDP